MMSQSSVISDHSSPVTGGLQLIYGHPAARDVGFYMAAEWMCQGETRNPKLIVVDGENSFDPFVFGDAARRVGLLPDTILRNLFVSRAFTCHQLQALIVERLIPAIQKTCSQVILVLGLLTTFYDEQVPMWEAQRLLRPTLGRLRGLAQRGYSVMILLPTEPRPIPQRQLFLQWTKACSARVLRVDRVIEEEQGLQRYGTPRFVQGSYVVNIHPEKPTAEATDWQIRFDPAMQPRKRWQSVG